MTQLEKMRNKLSYMSDFINDHISVPKEEQQSNLYEWAEQWGNERIGDFSSITNLLQESKFWAFWKLSVYQIQLLFVQNMYVDKFDRPYLRVYSAKTKTCYKEFDKQKIKGLYIKFMSEMVLGKAPQSPTGEVSYHQFVKTISQSK